MSATTIHVSVKTRDTLHDLARAAGIFMQEVIDQALEIYRRQQLLSAANDAYAALRTDPKAWKEVHHEREEWDATSADGLEDV